VPTVVIVGGGISGLATAYYLAKAGIPSTLVERQPRLGGVIRTEIRHGCLLEAGPDSFLAAKPWALDLIRELGLAEEVIGSNDHLRITYVRKQGRLVPLPDGLMLMVPTRILPMFSTKLLAWSTKFRMGLECLRGPARSEGGDRSVAVFLRDHYGQEAVDYLAEPLLAGVYGGDPEKLSAESVLTRFVELERKYGSLTRGVLAARRRASKQEESLPLFQTLKGGLERLIDALVQAAGGQMKVVEATAEAVEPQPRGFQIRTTEGLLQADCVVLACQAYQAGAMVRLLDPRLFELLASIPYNSSITVALGFEKSSFDQPQDGFGFLVPKRERRRLVAGTWVGTKFSYRVPDDKVVLRCFLGGGDEAALDESDDTLVVTVMDELREIMGLKARPVFRQVARWPRSMAQYTVGHQKRVEAIEARLHGIPGLFLAGNAYYGIGIPDCIRTGKVAAERIASLGR
jgi:oxygen-dependent protoporphyrinogen oxidase